MTVRTASKRTPGARVFYVGSESKPSTEYTVQFIRRNGQCRWFCTCPDFTYRRLSRKRHCKHIRFARQRQTKRKRQ